MPSTLTVEQLDTIQNVERAVSVFSILGALFIIITFLGSAKFRKPVNRIVFFASWGNLCSNIATIIAQAGPRAGENSALCKIQGLFIQWFLPADVLFCFAMAANVFASVVYKVRPDVMRSYERYWIAGAYGIPLIPGLIYIFDDMNPVMKTNPIIGDAVLWCWVSSPHDLLRLVAFYIPVWLVIVATIVLYLWVGKKVNEIRTALQDYKDNSSKLTNGNKDSPGLSSPRTESRNIMLEFEHREIASPAPVRFGSGSPSRPVSGNYRSHHGSLNTPTSVMFSPDRPFSELGPSQPRHAFSLGNEQGHNLERRYSSDDDDDASSVLFEEPAPTGGGIAFADDNMGPKHGNVAERYRENMRGNAALWAYARCAVLFFLGLVVTWIPSTVNRVYGYVHPDDVHYKLQLAAAFVLPAQGLWNCFVYMTTSWWLVRDFFTNLPKRIFSWIRHPSIPFMPARRFPTSGSSVHSFRKNHISRSNTDITIGEDTEMGCLPSPRAQV